MRFSCATPPMIPARERQHLDQLLGKRIDGLVVTARRADKRAPIGPLAHGLPVIYVFSQADDPGALSLLPDDEGGAVLGRRASGGARPKAHRPCHGAGALRGGAGCGTRATARALAEAGLPEIEGFYLSGCLVRGVGARGRGEAVLRTAKAGRHLLRQRPDRPRRDRHAARDGTGRARRRRRSSASTIGT